MEPQHQAPDSSTLLGREVVGKMGQTTETSIENFGQLIYASKVIKSSFNNLTQKSLVNKLWVEFLLSLFKMRETFSCLVVRQAKTTSRKQKTLVLGSRLMKLFDLRSSYLVNGVVYELFSELSSALTSLL